MEIKGEKQIRLLKEIEAVVYDKDFAKKNPDLELYQVYRGVERENGIRYDITVIPPQKLGKEFVRTKGNRNSNNFSELYTVLNGQAIFLLQKAKKDIVEDVKAVKVKKGEYIIISAEYAVIIINASNKELKTGNWVAEENENIYEELEQTKGMAYFGLAQWIGIKWVKNKNYKEVPKIRFKKSIKQKPESLDFLKG